MLLIALIALSALVFGYIVLDVCLSVTPRQEAPLPVTPAPATPVTWMPGALPALPEPSPASGTWADSWLTADDARALRTEEALKTL